MTFLWSFCFQKQGHNPKKINNVRNLNLFYTSSHPGAKGDPAQTIFMHVMFRFSFFFHQKANFNISVIYYRAD